MLVCRAERACYFWSGGRRYIGRMTRLPSGTCRDYTKNPPFYECGNEEQHMALDDVTVVSFGGQVPAAEAEEA